MIDYYYVPISGYAYLGEPRLVELAHEFDKPVNFYPVNIADVFKAAQVTPPAAQSHQRIAYRRQDLARTAQRLGQPINETPAHWPVDPQLACRSIYAAVELGLNPHAVSFALLRAIYAQDRDIADPAQVADILNKVGIDGDAILTTAKQPSTLTALNNATAAAVKLGMPGSPTYVLGEELFFGQDRLVDLRWRLGQSIRSVN